MEERKEIFKEYVEAFKDLHEEEKKSVLINSVKELIGVFDELSKSDNISLEYVQSNEILDLNQESVSNSDFLEALFVYLEVSKDIIGQYIIKKENL